MKALPEEFEFIIPPSQSDLCKVYSPPGEVIPTGRVLEKQIRIIVVAEDIISKLARNPSIPKSIRQRFKLALNPLAKLAEQLNELSSGCPLNWRDRVNEVMEEVSVLFEALNMMETRAADDSLQKKAIKTALLRMKRRVPRL